MPKIQVRVIEGEKLVAKDSNGFSDPYVRLSIDRSTYQPPQTKVQQKTLDPKWDEVFEIAFKEEHAFNGHLICDIFDHDKFSSDDSMGCVTVPLRNLKRGQEFEGWFDVGKSLNEASKDATGRLHLVIRAIDFGIEDY
eukprot:TRINITY_DN5349_c0_g1_i1.p1 TRINITY_DN5349_c0_g1~~TRINITY_DN5349_c0_g1_i1.p1  ORF type:complete len:138 (-),score=25.19 TRINITY_DN5349_c0_g1_i1:43-456(-)